MAIHPGDKIKITFKYNNKSAQNTTKIEVPVICTVNFYEGSVLAGYGDMWGYQQNIEKTLKKGLNTISFEQVIPTDFDFTHGTQDVSLTMWVKDETQYENKGEIIYDSIKDSEWDDVFEITEVAAPVVSYEVTVSKPTVSKVEYTGEPGG